MEDECCQLQVRAEKMDAYIEDLLEHVEELATENKLLKGQLSQLKKRKAEEAGVPKETSNPAGSKRLRVGGGGDEDKENREYVTVRKTNGRRSSCVFGIGVGKQQDPNAKEENKSKGRQPVHVPQFTSAGALSEKKVSAEEEKTMSPRFGGNMEK